MCKMQELIITLNILWFISVGKAPFIVHSKYVFINKRKGNSLLYSAYLHYVQYFPE